MSFYHNPRVITDQLVFYIDAKNYKSYTTSSLNIKNLAAENTASFVDGLPSWDNNSFQIDGANNYAVIRRETIPELHFTEGDFSVEVWTKYNSFASWHYEIVSIWNTGATTDNEWALGWGANKIAFFIQDASSTTRTVSSVENAELNIWYHLVNDCW